ncbi:MAG: threonine aldolase family protein [Rhodospirillaceae bacterium]|jgi:threonine aldolase|nr:threonine aldolase family protein [Rhodospirillaceae bacterium]
MFDFYSDTKTKPSLAMREATLSAVVGDEQKDEDPTTLELCERVAARLGKEAAVFLPSGTMCNEIAIRVHTNPGDEVICERTCHLVNYESGGPAAISGIMIHAIDGENGIFEPDQVSQAIRPNSRYMPESRLVCVEQTANLGGGAIWPLEKIQGVAQTAKDAGLSTHMDGARLMNAVVKSGIAAATWVEGYDSCWIDFTKGLGAPVGAVLAGSTNFIRQAWRIKQQMGGSMRQSGIIASMCLYALDHNVDRLAEDHDLAASIATRIAALNSVINVLSVDTNIVIFDLSAGSPDAASLVASLQNDGIQIGAFGERRIRIVTHLDVDPAAGDALCQSLEKHL